MSARGAYYKAKYARKGPSNSSPSLVNESEDTSDSFIPFDSNTPLQYARGSIKNERELQQLLLSMNRMGYGAYKRLQDHSFHFPQFQLDFTYVQGDPHAPPSSVQVFIPHQQAKFPTFLFENKIRKVAFADYLHRHFLDVLKDANRRDTRAQGWTGPRGGYFRILAPSPYVLERSAMSVTDAGILANFQVALPAFGRSIAANACIYAVVQALPGLIQNTFMAASHRVETLREFVECIEDQDALRNMLGKQNDLVAFIANGSVLPRASGDSALPLPDAIPWTSPERLVCEFDLPNRGTIRGTGIRRGITLLLGGGFHGKSTLLQSLQLGVYNKTPRDGREFVVSVPTTQEARSEDGRCLHAVGLSPFITALPFMDPTCVSTQNASGSTSLAAAIQEAVELRTQLVLMDEDVCATNFLIRDDRIAQLVPNDPIVPFVQHIRGLAQHTSFVLVVGGCGDYLDVADTILCMDAYVPKDITHAAKRLVAECPVAYTPHAYVPSTATRSLAPPSSMLQRKMKWNIPNAHLAMSPTTHWDLDALSTLVEVGQMRSLVDMFHWVAQQTATSPHGAIPLHTLYERMQQADLQTLIGNRFASGMNALPRPIDMIRAINRLRVVNIDRAHTD